MRRSSSRWPGACGSTGSASAMNEPDTATNEAFQSASARTVQAVVIGASAGGFEALMRMLPVLPEGYRLPIAIVVHLPESLESRLAELFDRRLAVPVREARDKEAI